MKTFVIDRFESNYAICEDEEKAMIKVPKYRLPLECKEGDHLYLDSDNMYQIAKVEQKSAESRLKEKMSRLFDN